MEYLSSVFYLNRLQILFVKNILRNDKAALLSFHFLLLYLSRYFVMHGLYLSTENKTTDDGIQGIPETIHRI